MYSFQSMSDSMIFIPRIVKLDYIYRSQLTSLGRNRHAKQNVVIRDFKSPYIYCGQGIKYPMYSFKSESDWIIFIHRRVK
jgi:hypothetical protein